MVAKRLNIQAILEMGNKRTRNAQEKRKNKTVTRRCGLYDNRVEEKPEKKFRGFLKNKRLQERLIAAVKMISAVRLCPFPGAVYLIHDLDTNMYYFLLFLRRLEDLQTC